MSQKRDLDDIEDGEVSDTDAAPAPEPEEQPNPEQSEPGEPRPKRLKTTSSFQRHQNAGIDATWGQKSVFSSGGARAGMTTIPAGLKDDFEDDSDAMAYLMAVRQEAHSIPHLLRAPTHQIGPQLPADFERLPRSDEDGEDGNDQDYDDEGSGDMHVNRGMYEDYESQEDDAVAWYEDGAYIAKPLAEDDNNAEDEEVEEDVSPPAAIQAAYYHAILTQYSSLRTLLHAEPPDNALSRLPRFTQTEVGPIAAGSTIATWRRIVRTADPHPLRLALMSKESVIRLLRIVIGGKFLKSGRDITERTSRWIWGLLARLPERGQMDHTEIGWIRELGRRAVLLGSSLTEMARLREELDGGGLGVHEGFDLSDSEDEFGVCDDMEVVDEIRRPSPKRDAAGSQDDLAATAQPESTAILQDTSKTNPQGSKSTSAAPSGAGGHTTKESQAQQKIADTAQPKNQPLDSDHEDGEISEDGDVPMDLASNASSEDGVVQEGNLEDAKARLLAQVDAAVTEDEHLRVEEDRELRGRMNMRATVTMILTIAGEAYGQRDLLEFRDPFVGI